MTYQETVLVTEGGWMGAPERVSYEKFRTMRKFLWLPLEIADEERWLCWASWREEWDAEDGEWEKVCWMPF